MSDQPPITRHEVSAVYNNLGTVLTVLEACITAMPDRDRVQLALDTLMGMADETGLRDTVIDDHMRVANAAINDLRDLKAGISADIVGAAESFLRDLNEED